MKKLPIGIQNFRKIIEGDYLYVDKTKYVYDLINDISYCFLSRPRRFGKSLLLDTIAETFNGERELFKGLWIYDSGYEFKKHPVISLDMSKVSTKNPEELEDDIIQILNKQIRSEKLNIDIGTPSYMFSSLISELHDKYNERVVVLIDEYDKPILDHITDYEMAVENRKVIKNFYGILKSMDGYLHFVMMTGVSKFTKTSVFSELNNMVDITMDAEYANICGITVEDLETHFSEHIDSLSSAKSLIQYSNIRKEILRWYDGYSWDGETRVLNPFSLLSFFSKKRFMGFWYDSGTPGFLVSLIKKRPEEFANICKMEITEGLLNSGDLNRMAAVPLMFQSGYLTVSAVKYDTGGEPAYVLAMPNLEVKEAFNLHVMAELTENTGVEARTLCIELRRAFRDGDMQRALVVLQSLFASIPYELHVSNEAYYHSIFYALMSFTGLDIDAEVSTSRGRVDAVLDYGHKLYIMEFKYSDCSPSADDDTKKSLMEKTLDEAMEQIEEKGYHEKFMGSGKVLFKIAIAFIGRDSIDIRYRIEPNRLN